MRSSRLESAIGRRTGALLKAAASLCVIGLLGGCETKDFLDPKEMTIRGREPLVMPILKSVDPTVDEVNPEFANATDPTPEDRVVSNSDYRISRGDQLTVSISDLNGPGQETVKPAKVEESGTISLPFVQLVQAEGLTAFELEQSISEAYRTANLINNAQVSVNVVVALGRAYELGGAVARPAQYPIPQADFHLLDALLQGGEVQSSLTEFIYVIRRVDSDHPRTRPATTHAPANTGGGGPNLVPNTNPTTGPTSVPGVDDLVPKPQTSRTPAIPDETASANRALSLLTEAQPADSRIPAGSATERVQLVQAQDQPSTPPQGAVPTGRFEFNAPPATGNVRIIRIPYQALHNGDLNYNIVVRPYDIIIAQPLQTGFYYIAGHVARPGVFTLTGQKVTVKQAIMGAGMFDELAIPQRTEIIRHVRPDHEVIVRLDLTKIFGFEQPDIYLRPDDQILVGTNAVAPFLAAIRGAFRITYGFGFLYDRNYSYSNNSTGAGL